MLLVFVAISVEANPTTDLNLALFQPFSSSARYEDCPDTFVVGASGEAGKCPWSGGKILSVAAIQAALDFNARNDRFNSGFSGPIMSGCDKQIELKLLDSGFAGNVAVSNFVKLLYVDSVDVDGIIGAGTLNTCFKYEII